MEFIDTHTHLYLENFDEDRKEIVQASFDNNVTKILLPNIDEESLNPMQELADSYPENIFQMIGLHPSSVKEDYKDILDKYYKLLSTDNYIAIGEIGIDFYWDKTFKEEQIDAFTTQMNWALEKDMGVSIHTRDSFETIKNAIEQINSNRFKGVFHCFTGSKEEADWILDKGFKLGIGGIVTFKNSGLDKTLSELKLENLVLETDSPFLTPTPYRGKRNESSYIPLIANKVAEIYNVSIEQVAEITSNNAKEIFLNNNYEHFDTSILLIYTGGTIGMVKDEKTGSLIPYDFSNIYEQVPELEKFNYHIETISFNPTLDSSDINPNNWIEIANIIKNNYESYEGFVVLHGSDTMAYTASALSFILKNLNKPVVVTGSQLPMGMLRTDGRENLISAIEIAAALEDETPIVPEVTIFFENQLYRGNRTYKYNAENFNAFVSGNYPILAESGVNLVFNKDKILKPNFKKLKLNTKIDSNVALLKIFPGMSKEYVSSILNITGVKAIILESFGSGNSPTSEWFISEIKDAIKRGIIIVNISQCISGSVSPGKYAASLALSNAGVINGKDLTTASAITKMMICLGKNKSREAVVNDFIKNWAGELS